jgi:transferase CAF17, mitochondrial
MNLYPRASSTIRSLQKCCRGNPRLPFFRQRRSLSSTSGDETPHSKGITRLADRRLVSITGKDAAKLLQGLITNNIETLLEENRSGFYAAFLNSHGRLLTDSFIYRIPKTHVDNGKDGFWIEVDESLVKILCQYLQRHRLRSEVAVKPLDGSEFNIWVAWTEALSDAGQSVEYDSKAEVVHLPDPRLQGFANRFVVPGTSALDNGSYSSFAQLPEVTERDYLLRRCLWGLTEGHKAMTDGRALPHEFNLDLLNAIDFKKGCYIGQELTIRTQHQGVVRKRVLPALIYPTDTAPPSSLSFLPNMSSENVDVGGRIKRITPSTTNAMPTRRRNDGAGNWIEGVGNIGLALCRLEMMTDVRITADQDAKSFTEDAEFEVEQTNRSTVKVKAFVPEWLRNRIGARQGTE